MPHMKLGKAVLLLLVSTVGATLNPPSVTQPIPCDLTQYKSGPGLTAGLAQDLLTVSWAGQSNTELRARYAIDAGQPVLRDLAVRKTSGTWAILGENLTPEYHVVSGVRR